MSPFELERPVEADWPGTKEDIVPFDTFRALGERRLDTVGSAAATEPPVNKGLREVSTEDLVDMVGTTMLELSMPGTVDADMVVGLEDVFDVPEDLMLTKVEDDFTTAGLEDMFAALEALLVLAGEEYDTRVQC